ncbi:MAG: AAA family ATPase [Myxococcales bacterium]|nr:AAA family ATPase [Myxococcales bacterium]
MNTGDFERYLRIAFETPCPFLVLVSHEERRVAQIVLSLAANEPIPVSIFTEQSELSPDQQAIAAIRETTTRHIWVLCDSHIWMRDAKWVRRLRDLREHLISHQQTLVLVQPVTAVPLELERDVDLIELSLPSADELAHVLRRAFADANAGNPTAEAEQSLVRAAKGLTEDETYRMFRRLAVSRPASLVDALAEVAQEKRRLIRMSDLLELYDDIPDLTHVGGLTRLKQWLLARTRAFSQDARVFGLPQPKGLLLLGVQGCGKSLTAKVIARMWHLPLARLDLGQLFRRGAAPEEALRQVLRLSESLAPLILWVDEIEKSFHGIGHGAGEVIHRVFASFITWLQEKQAPVFVVATANSVDQLPPELLRKGRFDEIFFVDLPDIHERKAIFEIHLRGRGRTPANFDLETLATKTEHFSGAEIEQCVIGALFEAFSASRDLNQQDLLKVTSETVPIYFTYEEQTKRLRDWAKTRARNASSDSRLLDLFGNFKD